MDKEYLIVPVSSQALVISDESKVVDLSSDLENDEILGEYKQYDIDTLYSPPQYTLDQGIHIHWKLPKLLKHSFLGDSGVSKIPNAPNRWMILRYRKSEGVLDSKSWIVKSDALNNSDHKAFNWAEYNTSTNQFDFTILGNSEEWTAQTDIEGKVDSREIYGVGSINPAFNSSYLESLDVFSFHDKMQGCAKGDTYSYVLIGWYTDLSKDPICCQEEHSLIRKIKRDWLTKNELELQDIERSVFLSNIYNVQWENGLKSGVPTEDVKISIGNNSKEAVSAFLLDRNKSKIKEIEHIEDRLNALQNDLLEDPLQLPDLVEINLKNDKSQFVPKSRGTLWQIHRKEKPLDDKKKKEVFPPRKDLVDFLNDLNNSQKEYNIQKEVLSSLRQEYYFIWYKETLDSDKIPNANIIKQDIERKIEASKTKLKRILLEIERRKKTIMDIDLFAGNNPIYELHTVSEPLFYEANEPYILLEGGGLGDVDDYYQDILDSLKCQVSSKFSDNLEISIKGTNSSAKGSSIFGGKINLSYLDGLRMIDSGRLKTIILQSLLLDPGLADMILPKSGESVQAAQDKKIAQLERFAFKQHKQAWEPIYMLWKVEFTPHGESKSIECKGLSPITTTAAKNLSEKVDDDSFKDLQRVLGQSLSGFNKQLLAQNATIQLPPLLDDDEYSLDLKTMNILGYENGTSPHTASNSYKISCNPSASFFSNWRNGELAIKHISLLDVYGQRKNIIDSKNNPNVLVSNALSDSNLQPSTKPIKLEPRYGAPTRLTFNWINEKGDEIHQDMGAVSHPVLAWLVPVHLENKILIYNPEGKEIKALSNISKNTIEEYYPNADESLNANELENYRKTLISNTLQSMIDKLSNITFLEESKKVKEKVIRKRKSAYQSPMHLIYGDPVAIARGKLHLDQLRPLSWDPRWGKSQEETGNVKSKKIRVQVGLKDMIDDGLLGYFIGDDYDNLLKTGDYIEMSLEKPEVDLTLILTAGSKCYIKTEDNVLPYTTIELFSHTIEELTNNVNVSFMVSPFIADSRELNIPVPNTEGVSWNWVHKTDTRVWEEPQRIIKQHANQHFDFVPRKICEGWIKLSNLKINEDE